MATRATVVKEHTRRSSSGKERTIKEHVKEHSVREHPVELDELLDMRCRACGMFMGYRRRIGRFVFWCSEDCADTPMAKWQDAQVRDEVIVELFLSGTMSIMEISRALDDWPYQYIQQTLTRRGLTKDNLAS